MSFDQENLLFSITRQLGTSVEKYFLTKRLNEAERVKASEELQQTILNSVSHEMRTPLTAILGMASAMDDEKMARDPEYVRNISHLLQEAGGRLNNVIENLLDMSRLSSGMLSLKLEWHDANDLLGVVVEKNAKSLSRHSVQVSGLDDIALIKIDFRLMEHAVSNLLLNAAAYSPAGTTISVRLIKQEMSLFLEVADEGPGIPEELISKVFDKFYRVPGTPTGGTGLGLSIVKSIVELHHGSVQVQNRDPHGACFRIELPIAESPEYPKEND